MVTVETAVGMIAVAVVLAFCSALVGLVIQQGQCEEVATQVARQVARGDDEAARRASQAAPLSAEVVTTTRSGWVTVVVTMRQSWGSLGPVEVQGAASMPLEPGVGAP
ncbi:TadE family type IV pilus minor pilin [Aestuariimicrobium soli]|uniref:TadE family type IV pilus minor pilin n=1 Tax=Aestuariimicrobium soli TaxID=2035834 RepID=UPI003EBA1E1D